MGISVEDVSFAYGRKVVLDGLSWQVRPGVTGLLGPNGAGKTTLLSLLVTLTRPRSGRIRIAERDPARAGDRGPVRALIGYVPQRFSLVGAMTVRDTAGYAAWVNGISDRACMAAGRHALALVGLEDKAPHRVRTLSGGQRQRLGIAAALAHDPRIVVLDEPTAGLDPGQRLRVREVIANIGADRTVLLSTHLIEDVTHLCDRIGVIAAGRIAFDGSFAELSELMDADSSGPRTALGSSFERAYDSLITRLGGQP